MSPEVSQKDVDSKVKNTKDSKEEPVGVVTSSQEIIKERQEIIKKEILKFYDCFEQCKDVRDTEKYLIDISLFQGANKDILGIPGKGHEEQSKQVLSHELYWELSNIRKLLEMRKDILGKDQKSFASFSVGGSIGASYLGYLHGAYESGKMPEVIFGASAGSLFPMLYLLWQKALKSNPQETKVGLQGLLTYIPQNLGDKTMWSNGEELIEEFKKSGQMLIDIINRGDHLQDGNLPSIEDISITQISPTFGIIASRKKAEGGFQEVVFSGKDNLLKAIIASSNPEISILGIRVSVLTNTKNKFLGNTWHDGDHTNYNPIKYGEMLGIPDRTQIISLPVLKKESENYIKLQQSGQLKLLEDTDFGEFMTIREKTDSKTFLVASNIQDIHPFGIVKSDYKPMDQNNGWNKELMDYRAKLSYIKVFMENTPFFSPNVEKRLFNILDKIQLSDTDKTIIQQQIHAYYTSRIEIDGIGGSGKGISFIGLDVGK